MSFLSLKDVGMGQADSLAAKDAARAAQEAQAAAPGFWDKVMGFFTGAATIAEKAAPTVETILTALNKGKVKPPIQPAPQPKPAVTGAGYFMPLAVIGGAALVAYLLARRK